MQAQEIKKVLVIGSGLMGRQIALQCALFEVEVSMFGRSEISLARARRHLKRYAQYLIQSGYITPERAAKALDRITLTMDPVAAAADADLVSESVTENLELKRADMGAVWETPATSGYFDDKLLGDLALRICRCLRPSGSISGLALPSTLLYQECGGYYAPSRH